ncbi:MAG: transcriptional repressor [Deltaproteobacteria bacterium]|jgi:Fur family ferric uptake transcriptional regulator|nr:transcriptional repressor [Deltaproteobacteria bacterium]
MKRADVPHSQRVTRQRTIILEELRKVVTHPTADELYHMVRRRLPRISLGTVYRNLDLLAEQGEILKIDSSGYSKRFDGNLRPHQHVHCLKCGKVADIMLPVSVPDTRHVVLPGFTITAARLEFDGLCTACYSPQACNM